MINKDPIEKTENYKLAMEKIDPILDKEFPINEVRYGTCYRFWQRKKELLKEQGIDWKTPKEVSYPMPKGRGL